MFAQYLLKSFNLQMTTEMVSTRHQKIQFSLIVVSMKLILVWVLIKIHFILMTMIMSLVLKLQPRVISEGNIIPHGNHHHFHIHQTNANVVEP